MLDVYKKVAAYKRCVKKLFKPIVQFFFSEHSALSFMSTSKLCLPVS